MRVIRLIPPARLFLFLVLVAFVALATPAAYAAPKVTISETFTNSTAAGWVLSGTTCLTAGSTTGACAAAPNNEGNGNGWLRLTSATGNQAGSAIYNTAFPSSDGIQITFEYATYGGNGADGFSYYLIDGATAVPTVGAAGGGLGYSFNTINPIGPGVTNGYAAVGFDEFGNFGNTGYSSAPCFTSLTPGVTVFGSGSLNTGFRCLQHTNTTIVTTNRAGARTVRITITPGATSMTVQVNSGSGFVTVVNAFNLSTATGQVALPATFKMGFSASTGGSNNFHEIRNLNVGGAQPSTTTPVCVPNPSIVGQSVTCTATVTGAVGIPTGTIDFYDGTTLLAAGVVLNGSGQATYTTTAFALGTHPITANYSGSGTYGASSGSTSQVVNKVNTTTVVTSSRNPSTYGQAVTFTATVTPQVSGVGTPSGTVTFQDGGVNIPGCVNVTLNGSAQATCGALTNLAIGSHSITAVYGGDTVFNGSSGPLTQLVNQVAPQPAAPSEVPEGDTLLLLGSGMGGFGVWLRYQWNKRKRAK